MLSRIPAMEQAAVLDGQLLDLLSPFALLTVSMLAVSLRCDPEFMQHWSHSALHRLVPITANVFATSIPDSGLIRTIPTGHRHAGCHGQHNGFHGNGMPSTLRPFSL